MPSVRPELLCLSVLLLLSVPTPSVALSPPWWVTYNLFHEALHRDSCLNISTLAPANPPGTPAAFHFNITILCSNASDERVSGLATFLTVQYNFGGTALTSRVYSHSGKPVLPVRPRTPAHALRLAGAALQSNPWFVRTAVSSPLPCLDFYWVVCSPTAAQVWADNLADLWGNINMLAETLFARVLRLDRFGLRATTQPPSAPPHVTGTHEGQGPAERQQGHQQRHQQQHQRQQEVVACAPGQDCHRVATTHEDGPQQSQRQQGRQQGQQEEQVVVACAPGQRCYTVAASEEVANVGQLAGGAGVPEEVWEEDQSDGIQLSSIELAWRRGQQQQPPPQQQQQRHQVVLGAGGGRRQLASTGAAWWEGSRSDWSWDVAAKCWALGLARRMGGELAARQAARWLV